MSSTEQLVADRRLGVRVATFADRLNQGVLDWGATREVTECVLNALSIPLCVNNLRPVRLASQTISRHTFATLSARPD